MRRLSVLMGVVFLCLGCARGPAEPEAPIDKLSPDDTTATRGPAEPSASEHDAAGGDRAKTADEEGPLYLGKPLGYWIEQAGAANRREALDAIVEGLTLALGSEEHAVMVAAADALQVLGPEAKAAAPMLAGKLDHVQPWVRCAAMDALAAIGADAVPSLVETVQSGPGNAPIRAALVLGSIGPDAKEAIPALVAMQESSPDRRDRLEQVLAQIDPTRSRQTATFSGQTANGRKVPNLGLARTPVVPATGGGDWPQFHGPGRDSLCGEIGLLHEWPEGGPALLWELRGLGRGYSTVSIAGGRIFTMGDRRDDNETESQFVIAFDLQTRDELWATRIGGPHDDGPRSTPTVDGQLLYAIGTDGNVMCVETETGNVRWQKSLPDDFAGRMMSGWKYSESPLVDGNRLVCTPGGPDAAIVALDKRTGELIWKTALPDLGPEGKDGAAYSSIVAADIGGARQYVQLLGRGVVGVEADTGRFLWGYNRIANDVANITMPVVRGNLVFVTTSYDRGCALLEITRRGDDFAAEEIYFLGAKEFENHHGGVVLVGNHVYGGSGKNRGEPACLDLATGKIAWKEKAPGRGSAAVLYADGHLIFRYDRGLVALIEAAPDAFRLKGSFQAVTTKTGPAWAHPVIHRGRLYLRHDDLLLCYDLRL